MNAAFNGDARLSRIETMWSVVARAHEGQGDAYAEAQRMLIERYGGAVRRYALAVLRSSDAADEVLQEFALKFSRGDFASATPEKGRFRSFLKTTLYHLIVDYQRRQNKQARNSPLQSHLAESIGETSHGNDAVFINSYREEILSRVWKRIAEYEQQSGKPFHTVLRIRVENPDARSPELAELISQQQGKPMSPGAVRVLLHRAREYFGECLIDEIADTLQDDHPDAIEEELIDLDLWKYCKEALLKHQAKASDSDDAE